MDLLVKYDAAFQAFVERFAHLFRRREPREQCAKYLRGLLAPVQRKNGWQLAEAVGDATPDRMEYFLAQADWDADAARDELEAYVADELGEADGIGIVDETGFLKAGTHSVGVKRQYSGTAGKVENCQVATVLAYRTSRGHAFLDRRLYLPEEWAADAARRAQAQVPKSVPFQTKPEQAADMLIHAWQRGVPMRWVTGDEVYGNAPALRQTIADADRWYVLAVSSPCPVWTAWPAVEEPPAGSAGPAPPGRPRTQPRLAPDAPTAQPVRAVVAAWPVSVWQRFAVADGEKGPRVYDWAAQRVVETVADRPVREGWLLVRRSVSDPTDLAYYLSNAPAETSVQELARVAATRYVVEQCIEEAKGDTGLDEYEVRLWASWYRHITLSMLAHAWLAVMLSQPTMDPEKGGRGSVCRPDGARSPSLTGRGAALSRWRLGLYAGVVAMAAAQTSASQAESLSGARLQGTSTSRGECEKLNIVHSHEIRL